MICLIELNQNIFNFVYFLQWIFLFLPLWHHLCNVYSFQIRYHFGGSGTPWFAECAGCYLNLGTYCTFGGVVHTILNILAGYLPYSYSIYFTIERGNTLIPLEVYTYHTYILNISHLGRERVHTHTLRGVHLPYSYTWTRHTFPPRYGRAISYHRIHAQTKFRQTPPARGFSGSHIVRGFLRVFLDHFSEPGSSIWPALALASFHAA